MSYDKKLEDYMIGRATGYSDSTWGRQGAQFYTPPGGAMPPQGRGSAKANAPIIVHQPRRNRSKLNSSVQESSKSATSGAANSTNQSPITKKMRGFVRSYINDQGSPSTDDEGFFVAGEIIPKRDHLARLHRFYTKYWTYYLRKAERGETHSSVKADAIYRLRLAETGRYIAPTNKGGEDYQIRLWKEKSFLFWRWVAQSRPRQIKIAEYDRRLRLFLKNSLANRYSKMTCQGIPVSNLKPFTQFCFFLNSPLVHPVE